MGAWQSGHRKIKRLRPPWQSRPPSCRDVCKANTARIDHEVLVKRLEGLENDTRQSETVSVEKETVISAGETSRRTLEINGSSLRITYGNDNRDLKKFLDENLCKFDYGRCNERTPHLHGYLNGMPIVLKLPDATEESPARDGRAVSFKKEENSAPKVRPASNRDPSSKDQDNSASKPEPARSGRDPSSADQEVASASKIESLRPEVGGKTRACDIGAANESESKVSRQTSPMTRIRSANTSPCSVSKECLKSENYSFPGATCTRDRECAEKCATGDLPEREEAKNTGSNAQPETPSQNSNSENKRSGGSKKGRKKKGKTKWKPWAPPPTPDSKSEPLPDTSSIPRHVRYGSGAYALTDEEPKPKNTFKGENTTHKEENRPDDKTKMNRTQDITTAGLAMMSERSPFRPAETGRKKSKEDDNEYREYLTYLMLLDQSESSSPFPKCMKNFTRPDSTSDVLHSSRICRDPVPRLSKYAFLFESGKESCEKSVLSHFYDWENVCEPNYFAVPVQVPEVFDKVRKNSDDLEKERRSSEDPDIRNEQTLIIARTPPPRSSGTLLMGAKTVITVRENAPVRRYSDNCGAEESEVPPSEGRKSRKWLKKSSKPSKGSNTPGLPLVIISKDSINPSESHGSLNKTKRPKRSSRKSVKTKQPELPIFKVRERLGRSKPRESASNISREPRQTDKSYDDETSHRSNLSDDHDSREYLCQAERPTRYCGERKRNPHRRSRASKTRKVQKETGSKDSIKKSYKDRFRTFLARKSRQSFKKIRKILNRVSLSGRSSKKDIANCVSGRSSTVTNLNYPVMVSSKVTCTSGSNASLFEVEPQDDPTEKIIPPVLETCATSCATETEARIEKSEDKREALSCKSESRPCDCPDNPGKSDNESLALCECPRGGACDGMRTKKKCSVFLCCIESTSSPRKIERKRKRKKRKKKVEPKAPN